MAITFGLDISHHQDLSLDLARARADGCEFVFIKAGEGGSLVDDEFAANLAEASAAGQLVAAYWFVRANASAGAHVALMRRVVPLDVPIILDVENPAAGAPPTLAQARAVLDATRSAGYRTPLSYIPLWFWRDVWGRPSLAGWPPLWSSRYPDMVVGTLSDEWADVPASYWTGFGGLDVAVLQFTSSARIAGYQPLDANAFRGTRADLAGLLGQGGGGSAPAAPSEEEEEEMDPIQLPESLNQSARTIPWNGKAGVLNVITTDLDAFVSTPECWGPTGGVGGGEPTNPKLPTVPGGFRVTANLPGAFRIPAGTTRIFYKWSSSSITYVWPVAS